MDRKKEGWQKRIGSALSELEALKAGSRREGKGRFSKKEFKQFLYIARGSLYETVTMLQIFVEKKWLDQETYERLYSEAEQINKMLSGLINSIK